MGMTPEVTTGTTGLGRTWNRYPGTRNREIQERPDSELPGTPSFREEEERGEGKRGPFNVIKRGGSPEGSTEGFFPLFAGLFHNVLCISVPLRFILLCASHHVRLHFKGGLS